jgi:ComF family protein
MEWKTKIQTFYSKFLISLGLCDLCGNSLHVDPSPTTKTPKQTLLCSSCLTDLPLFKQDFIQGDLLNWPSINKALPNIHFDHLVCLSPYLPPFTQWLPQFKYQGRFELAPLFAHLLSQQWEKESLTRLTSSVDLILSVPLHISKWQIRGYNQAHLLAKYFANHMQLPYDETALIRTKKNISQVGKTGAQRRNNLANAFSLAKQLPNNTKHVILIDDVLTTGSTASEISKLLKCAGVDKVTITTVCLTLPKTNN